MYKVFLNDKLIKLIDDYADYQSDENTLFVHFSSKEALEFAIDLLTDNQHIQNLIIFWPNLDELWQVFQEHFSALDAAGGVVLNDQQQVLMIFKRGKWDLPKGKIDPGESTEKAALREVEEECGVKDLSISKPLTTSYHIFYQDNQKILKRTRWYVMKSNHTAEFSVDKNEGIERAQWLSGIELEKALNNSYSSIKNILSKARTT